MPFDPVNGGCPEVHHPIRLSSGTFDTLLAVKTKQMPDDERSDVKQEQREEMNRKSPA